MGRVLGHWRGISLEWQSLLGPEGRLDDSDISNTTKRLTRPLAVSHLMSIDLEDETYQGETRTEDSLG